MLSGSAPETDRLRTRCHVHQTTDGRRIKCDRCLGSLRETMVGSAMVLAIRRSLSAASRHNRSAPSSYDSVAPVRDSHHWSVGCLGSRPENRRRIVRPNQARIIAIRANRA